jgi:hypothetical protein
MKKHSTTAPIVTAAGRLSRLPPDPHMETEILELIKTDGPLKGSEIHDAIRGDGIALWETCNRSDKLTIRRIGTRYLRLDRRVEGFARLSPSILREFLTYSVIGKADDPAPIEEKARERIAHVEAVSKAKLELAYRVISGIANDIDSLGLRNHPVCFIIAGDIVYNMGHDVPRPERSTGKLVQGSDIDLVVIATDDFPDDLLQRLDNAIYQEKYRLLIAPHVSEEIDYIVKKMHRVQAQLRFDTFKHMVACKIMNEGTLLYGSEKLFAHIKTLLHRSGVREKLYVLERRARTFRKTAESLLLWGDSKEATADTRNLFYPTEESEEFE